MYHRLFNSFPPSGIHFCFEVTPSCIIHGFPLAVTDRQHDLGLGCENGFCLLAANVSTSAQSMNTVPSSFTS